jgi:very-short-patch-repair endonuclease
VQDRDHTRDARLYGAGYRTLRFGDGAIISDLEAVVWVIEQELKKEKPLAPFQ